MKTEIDQLFDKLPDGSYESGWTQCMVFPIGKNSIAYNNGNRFAIQQKNCRTKDERYAMGTSLYDALTKFLALPKLHITETDKSHSLNFSD